MLPAPGLVVKPISLGRIRVSVLQFSPCRVSCLVLVSCGVPTYVEAASYVLCSHALLGYCDCAIAGKYAGRCVGAHHYIQCMSAGVVRAQHGSRTCACWFFVWAV